MTMYMYDFKKEFFSESVERKKICITNRQLLTGTSDYTPMVREQIIARLTLIAEKHMADAVILREKDLSAEEYEDLAITAYEVCRSRNLPLILHHFADVAARFHTALPLHLSVQDFYEYHSRKEKASSSHDSLTILGVSTHTVEEAIAAEKCGASYITASHIFPTACKAGLPPRGLDYLREVCESVSIPVFALGGIHQEQIEPCLSAGAAGVCMMSEYFGNTMNIF